MRSLSQSYNSRNPRGQKNRKWYQVTQRVFLHRRMERVFNDSLSVNLGMQGNMCLDTLRAQHRHDTTWQLKQTNQNLKDGCPGSLPAPQLEVSRSLLLSGSWTAGSEPQTAGRSRVPADHWRHWPLIKYTQRGTCLCMHSYWWSSGDIKYSLNTLSMQTCYICNTYSTVYLTSVCLINAYSFLIERSNTETVK